MSVITNASSPNKEIGPSFTVQLYNIRMTWEILNVQHHYKFSVFLTETVNRIVKNTLHEGIHRQAVASGMQTSGGRGPDERTANEQYYMIGTDLWV